MKKERDRERKICKEEAEIEYERERERDVCDSPSLDIYRITASKMTKIYSAF